MKKNQTPKSWTKQCKSFPRYKGLREPKCFKDRGCIACWTRWLHSIRASYEANVDPVDRNPSDYAIHYSRIPKEILKEIRVW